MVLLVFSYLIGYSSMGKKVEKQCLLEASFEIAVKAVANPDIDLEINKVDESVKETAAVVIEQSETRLIYEIRNEEYARTMTGSIDKSNPKTTNSISRVEWDLTKGVAQWSYIPQDKDFAKKFVFNGGYIIERTSATSSTVRCHMHVEVGIPVIGRLIERGIVSDIDKKWVMTERLLKESVAKLKNNS